MANECGPLQPNGNGQTSPMDGGNNNSSLQEQISTFHQRFEGWSPSEQRVGLEREDDLGLKGVTYLPRHLEL